MTNDLTGSTSTSCSVEDEDEIGCVSPVELDGEHPMNHGDKMSAEPPPFHELPDDNDDSHEGYGYEVVHQTLSQSKEMTTVCPPVPSLAAPADPPTSEEEEEDNDCGQSDEECNDDYESNNRGKNTGAIVCKEVLGATNAHVSYAKRNLFLASLAAAGAISSITTSHSSSSYGKPENRLTRFGRKMATHWRNSKVEILWAILYTLANFCAFTFKALHYYYQRHDATAVFGPSIIVARGAANCLNLNCALILFPMCRLALTKVWGFDKMKRFFPLDSSLFSHKTIGCVICFWTAVHVGAHIGDFYVFSHDASKDDIVALMNGKMDIHTAEDVPNTAAGRWALVLTTPAAITGIIMVVCIDVAYVSMVLQTRLGFNPFWYAHHLLIVMLALLVCHGMGSLLEPFESIYWIGFPLLLYGLPRIWRECPKLNKPRQVLELRANDGGDVVILRLSKSDPWDQMKAGMYFNLNIPLISRYEWHPFSNTAAPGDDYIEFHIRKVGDWTEGLCNIAQDLVWEKRGMMEHPFRDEENQDWHSRKSRSSCCDETFGTNSEQSDHHKTSVAAWSNPQIKVYVEGPIGASSQGFEDHRIIVLCGAGVGATPMVSVLKELLQNRSAYKMQRTYFYWTFRDLRALEWFASLLDEVFYTNTDCSVEGREMFVMKLFLTSKKTESQASFVHRSRSFRQIELDNSRIERINPHYKVGFGRPKWNEELFDVREEAKLLGQQKAGVFVSGPPNMARAIQRTAVKLSKQDPKFHFYCRKETFCSG